MSSDLATLTLEELVGIQPRHLRGKLEAGRHGPSGERPWRGHAKSVDFDGLSPYMPGDDVRTIDWRASLRSGETTIRRFAAASKRSRVVVLDLQPDLYFGTETRLMAKTACLTAAWLTWESFLLSEAVGLVHDSQSLRPQGGRRHIMRLLDMLETTFRSAKNNATQMPDLEEIAGLVGRQDEICTVAELPDDPMPLVKAARNLSAIRTLRLFLVEDAFTTRRPPPGRYPARSADGQRHVFRVQGDFKDDSDRIRQLETAGWTVKRASDLLPRGMAS